MAVDDMAQNVGAKNIALTLLFIRHLHQMNDMDIMFYVKVYKSYSPPSISTPFRSRYS